MEALTKKEKRKLKKEVDAAEALSDISKKYLERIEQGAPIPEIHDLDSISFVLDLLEVPINNLREKIEKTENIAFRNEYARLLNCAETLYNRALKLREQPEGGRADNKKCSYII